MNRNKSSLLVVTGLGILLVGCSSAPPRPTEALARADASIEQANQADARHADSSTLDLATRKAADAKAAADKGDMALAERLAHQAEVDAQLAAARGRAATAEAGAAEVHASTNTLREETVRPDVTPGS